MARLWRKRPGTPEGKYLVFRRDGTVPQRRWFVILDSDPAAPAALVAYAAEAERLGLDPQYVADVRAMAAEWAADLAAGKSPGGDPDAPPHRPDAPWVLELMRQGGGA